MFLVVTLGLSVITSCLWKSLFLSTAYSFPDIRTTAVQPYNSKFGRTEKFGLADCVMMPTSSIQNFMTETKEVVTGFELYFITLFYRHQCIGSHTLCTNGFSVAMWVYLGASMTTGINMIYSAGGQNQVIGGKMPYKSLN